MQSSSPLRLYPDGCIAQTFRQTPNASLTYMDSLLSIFPSPPVLESFNPDRRVFAHGVHPNSGPERARWLAHKLPMLNNTPGYVVDYEIDISLGEIIPQELWRPPSIETNAARLVYSGVLHQPIFFLRTDGGIGISVVNASAGATSSIIYEDTPANMGGKTTTHLCMTWPGHTEYKRQVEIQDSYKQPITLGRLVHRVGRFVDAFLNVMHEHCNEQSEFWSLPLGHNWRNPPRGNRWRESITIIGVLHTSQGCWQPILQLIEWHPSM